MQISQRGQVCHADSPRLTLFALFDSDFCVPHTLLRN